jgi:hypothetical protein
VAAACNQSTRANLLAIAPSACTYIIDNNGKKYFHACWTRAAPRLDDSNELAHGAMYPYLDELTHSRTAFLTSDTTESLAQPAIFPAPEISPAPPFIISEDQMDKMTSELDKAIEQVLNQ